MKVADEGVPARCCYRVVFYKHLVNCNGMPFRTAQGVVRVRTAQGADRAIALAKRRFAARLRARHWWLYADECAVEPDRHEPPPVSSRAAAPPRRRPHGSHGSRGARG